MSVKRLTEPQPTVECHLGQHNKCPGATTVRCITGGPRDGTESLRCTCSCHEEVGR